MIKAFNEDKPYSRFHSGADRRRRDRARRSGCPRRDRLPRRLPGQQQFARPRAAQISDHDRHGRHGRPGDSRHDGRLRALPQSQDRQIHAERLLSRCRLSSPTRPSRRRRPPKRASRRLALRRRRPPTTKLTKDIRAKQKAIIDSVRDAALKYHKERYLTDSRESIFKPKDQWNALDRWVNHRLDAVTDQPQLAAFLSYAAEDKNAPEHSPEIVKKWEEYREADARSCRSSPTSGRAAAPTPSRPRPSSAIPTRRRPIFSLAAIMNARSRKCSPPSLRRSPVKSPTSSRPRPRPADARRSPNWLASPTNPLTARVFVNRIWNQYFGKGIVVTVSDFGKAGDKPTNPELLDYLADNFVKNGWSVKKLHQSILLSATYRQSSDYREDVAKVDPENKLLAVFPRKRLEAEQIRDSVLVAAGKLNEQVGGPSVFPPLPVQSLRRQQFQRRSGLDDVEGPEGLHAAQHLHLHAPQPALSAARNIRHGECAADPQQARRDDDAASGADALQQRSDLPMVAGARRPRHQRSGRRRVGAHRSPLSDPVLAQGDRRRRRRRCAPSSISIKRRSRRRREDGKLALAIPVGVKDKPTDPLRASAFVDLVHTVAELERLRLSLLNVQQQTEGNRPC